MEFDYEDMRDLPLCGGCSVSLFELYDCTKDSKKLIEFLVSHRVIASEFSCPNCSLPCKFDSEGLKWICRRVRRVGSNEKESKRIRCNTRRSIRVDSFFDESSLSLSKLTLFAGTWLMIHPPKKEFLASNLNISLSSVCDWAFYCRKVCVDWVRRNSTKLGGPGIIVEANFENFKYDKGAGEGQWVFIGVERGTRNSFLLPVPNRDFQSLLFLIYEWILPESTIISECWKEFKKLNGFELLEEKYTLKWIDPESKDGGASWKDVLSDFTKKGHREEYFVSFLAEDIFHKRIKGNKKIHEFFIAAANMFNPYEKHSPDALL